MHTHQHMHTSAHRQTHIHTGLHQYTSTCTCTPAHQHKKNTHTQAHIHTCVMQSTLGLMSLVGIVWMIMQEAWPRRKPSACFLGVGWPSWAHPTCDASGDRSRRVGWPSTRRNDGIGIHRYSESSKSLPSNGTGQQCTRRNSNRPGIGMHRH